MGTLDDAIREHLALKRQKGAPENELEQKEAEAFGAGRQPPPAPAPEEELAQEPSVQDELLEPDEVLPEESLELNGTRPAGRGEPAPREDEPGDVGEEPVEAWEGEPEQDPGTGEDLLEETPDFLEETPEHDRLWFEQKPPKDFDLD
jgi:hypothetical protein